MTRLVSLLALTLLVACPGSDDTDGPKGGENSAIVGTWTLTKVDNNSLPATVQDGNDNYTIQSGGATVNENGTFTYSENKGDQGIDAVTGTWTKTGDNTYLFNPTEQPGEETQNNGVVTLSGTTMTLTVANVDFVRTLVKN